MAWGNGEGRKHASASRRTTALAAGLTSVPRLVVAVLGVWLLVVVWTTEWIAGALLLGGVVAFALVVRKPGHRILRIAAGGLVVTLTACLAIVSIATYNFNARATDQLITPSRDIAGAVKVPTKGHPMQVMGFLTPDYTESNGGLDRDAPALSDIASTRLTLSPQSLGHTSVLSVGTQTPLRAHVENAHAEAVLSNNIGDDFDGDLALRVLRDPGLRASLISDVITDLQASSPAWDGIVLDLENLPDEARPFYVQFAQELRAAMDTPAATRGGGDRLVLDVAIPAAPPDDTDSLQPYDLAELGKVSDRVVWMSYDEHAKGTPAGPIASVDWVKSTLASLKNQIPADKVLMGVATYGYKWSQNGEVDPVYAADMPAIRQAGRGGFDPKSGEERWTLPDGAEVWFSDAQSFAARAKLAAENHFAGIAVWKLGADEPNTFAGIPGPPIKYRNQTLGSRHVEIENGRGLVALTFDDGPDPTWTPQILDILAKEGVPGTFFDIGREVVDRPDLARREAEGGNVVGSHTFTHANLDQIGRVRQYLELLGGQAALEGAIGKVPLLFRPPYGAGDRVGGAGQSADALAAKLGLVEVDWTDDPEDWQKFSNPQLVTGYVLSHLSANTIVLLHDGGGNRQATVDALPGIIKSIRDAGYTFVTADAITGGLDSPYSARKGFWSEVGGGAVIAAFRLVRTVQILAADTVLALAVIAIIRLALVIPLALAQLVLAARRRRSADPDKAYEVTFIIPAFNEEAVITKSLESLLRLDGASRPAEIIVVDDGSTDATREIASGFGDRVRVIHKDNGGKASALNLGIGEASNEIIVVLDADTIVADGFIEAVAPHFDDPDVVAVAGNVRVGNRKSLLSNLQAIEYISSLNLDRRAQDTLNTIAVVPGAAGAFRRSAVIAAGGYPSDTLVEDADLTVVLLRRRGRIVYESRGLVWTEAPERLRDALKQRRRWAFGTVQLCVKHADVFLSPQAGRVGMVALPWTVVTQILLPVTSPITDFYLVWLLATGSKFEVVGMAAAIALAADLLLTGIVVAAEREQWRLLWYAPLIRWVWRPIQIYAVLSASRRWARGERQRWQPSVRYDTVNPDQLTARASDGNG